MDELTADFGVVVDQDDRAPRSRGGAGRGETRRPRADDKQVAMRVDLRIVGRRTIIRIDAAESGHGANAALKGLPARPEERLVVEACGQERRELVEKGGAIGGRRRRRIDRAHGEIVLERLGRGAQVRRRHGPPRDVDDRVRLLRPRAPDSARAMIFEAAADHADATGDERRGDAVALEAEIGLAVEGEGERSAAIDAAAGRQTKAAQGAGLVAASPLTVALTAVSRVRANISMQVRCSQISRA